MSLFLRMETSSPALENSLSDGTDVSRTHNAISITTVYHDVLGDCLGNTDQKYRRRKWYRITDTFCEY